jgi:hypothetical protein
MIKPREVFVAIADLEMRFISAHFFHRRYEQWVLCPANIDGHARSKGHMGRVANHVEGDGGGRKAHDEILRGSLLKTTESVTP